MLKIIPFYAALVALFYVYLSARTIGVRRKAKSSIGDGGDDEMLRAMHMHANFSQYTPIALILLANKMSHFYSGHCHFSYAQTAQLPESLIG